MHLTFSLALQVWVHLHSIYGFTSLSCTAVSGHSCRNITWIAQWGCTSWSWVCTSTDTLRVAPSSIIRAWTISWIQRKGSSYQCLKNFRIGNAIERYAKILDSCSKALSLEGTEAYQEINKCLAKELVSYLANWSNWTHRRLIWTFQNYITGCEGSLTLSASK